MPAFELRGLVAYDNPYHVELTEVPCDGPSQWRVQIMDAAYEEFVSLDPLQALFLLTWLDGSRDRLMELILHE